MENPLKDFIFISASVLILATFVATISWTIVFGLNIFSKYQEEFVKASNHSAVLSVISFSNLSDVDSVNLYKVLETNKSVIKDFSVTNLDGSRVKDTRELLGRPNDRFSITVKGDPTRGFQVETKEVLSQKVGN